ncbi:MAG: spheroidene monooxygenase [Actinomycetota bacterium]|nr:spheroidene monooxygenase [Actinomycetota bacterium]
MSTVASFHLTRYPAGHALGAMAGLVTRQRGLAATAGLRFVRQLGTGRGSRMGLGADLRRWATFAVWDDERALDAFLAESPFAARWRDQAEESWSVRLVPLSAHGSWSGARPLAELDPGADDDHDAPVAVLTRARIGLRHWPAFYRSVPAVEAHLHRQGDLLAAVGIGEAPVGLLATFSLWRSTSGMDAFAYRDSAHGEVVRRTRSGGWFSEELFARFRPYGSTGTWDGADPLAERGRAGGKGS